MILVRHLDLKFLNEFAAIIIGTSNPPHYMMSSFVPLTAPGARGKMSTADIAFLDRGNAQRPSDPSRKCDLPNTRLTVYLRA